MALSTMTKADVISSVRRRTGDSLLSSQDSFIADGLTVMFALTEFPCALISYSVTVDGTAMTVNTDYSITVDGVVTFLTGHVPSAGKNIQVSYTSTKLSDSQIWPFVVDAATEVNMMAQFGIGINDTQTDFETNPSLIAGTCLSIEASILILMDRTNPLGSTDGIMIKHGDETIDTKTPARIKQEMIKSLNATLTSLINRYLMYGSDPYLRP